MLTEWNCVACGEMNKGPMRNCAACDFDNRWHEIWSVEFEHLPQRMQEEMCALYGPRETHAAQGIKIFWHHITKHYSVVMPAPHQAP